MTLLSAREAYTLWAPSYEAETAVSHLDRESVAALGVATAGQRLLDVGCGTGRRLAREVHGARGARPALALGVDLTPAMLHQRRAVVGRRLVAGDVRALPLADASFDVVWCRLVIGHLRELGAAYAELARVCAPGGHVIVTDFHPDAVAAGHRRTFRAADGEVREVEHHVHSVDAHAQAARLAGLAPVARRDGRVGATVERFYAGRGAAFESQRGLALVLALAYERRA